MDRKKFLQATGIGTLLSAIPGVMLSRTLTTDNNVLVNNDPKIIRDQEGEVLNVIGDIQMHKLLGSDTGNQIFEWVDNVEPGAGIPPHIHTREDEIFRVIKGQIELMVNGETTILKDGDVAFAPKNLPHAWKVVGTEKAKMITTAFPAGIELMFNELSKLPDGPPNFEKVSEICGNYGISFV